MDRTARSLTAGSGPYVTRDAGPQASRPGIVASYGSRSSASGMEN